MQLQMTQWNAIYEAIEAVGLDPRDFDRGDSDDVEVRLVHRPSGSYFILGGSPSKYVGRYRAGDSVEWPFEVYSWNSVQERVSGWLRDVRSYVDTPDLWAGVLDKILSEEPSDLSEAAAPDGTITLAFTDIQGSTALNATFGDQAWLEVLRAHNQMVTSVTLEHGGTVVKGLGDGFMLAFSSARTALRASQAIQDRIAEAFNDPGSPIRVRIGIHTGEVAHEADDYFGNAVNYAARVAGAANSGEILVSSLTHDLLIGTGEFEFEAPREAMLKGFLGAQLLYPLVRP